MPLDDVLWTKFLRELKRRKCCLLLGPEINCLQSATKRENVSVLGAFSEYIRGRLIEEAVKLDEDVDNFYYRANKFINHKYADRPYLFSEEIEGFNNKVLRTPPPYFQKLVRLPFNSIVSMVPDNFVTNSLKDAGYEVVDEFYNYADPAKRSLELAEEMRLVYNVFGNYETPQSVAVTEIDQLTQIKSIVTGSPGVPNSITTRFKDETKSFLFLGFNFNDWHFRLIIDALQIPKPNYSFYPVYCQGHKVALMTKEFYNEKFGIKFVDPDTDNFLEKLIDKYEETYGELDRKLLCVLDYDDQNIDQFRALKQQLLQNGIAKRMDFFYKEVGQNVELLNKKTQKADVYIPFISSTFMENPDCINRANAVIGQGNTDMIPVIAGYTTYENGIRGIKQKKLMVLPRDGKALSSYQSSDLTRVCYELARTINQIIP